MGRSVTGGHGVECICKEIQKNLLKLHSIG